MAKHQPAHLARKQGYDGESPGGHFEDAVHPATYAAAVHNGMNEEPDIPRFGADEND